MNVYVNGKPVPHRPFRDDEFNALMKDTDDGVRRLFLFLECEPCVGGEDITCDETPDADEIWVRFPFQPSHGKAHNGNMRLHPENQ